MTKIALLRSVIVAALGLAVATLATTPAAAGVATSGAVLLDPFDPVPEIQFHHFGGYGCSYGCGASYDCGYRCDGGCEDSCGYRGCYDGCRRHYARRCEDGCYRRVRDCDDDCHRRDYCADGCRHRDDCDHDCGREAREAAPCTSANCYDAEHYERRWRDGDHVGQEWVDRGRREKVLGDHGGPGAYYGHENYDWHDDDDAPPPPDHDHDHH